VLVIGPASPVSEKICRAIPAHVDARPEFAAYP
jgi:hypothetical protein